MTQQSLDFSDNSDAVAQPVETPIQSVKPSEVVAHPVEPVSEPQDAEVEFKGGDEDLSAQEGQEAPQEESAEAPIDELDIIEPKTADKTWVIGDQSLGFEYIQTPLSFIGKIQWFALVGDVIDRAMSGPSAVSVNDLLSSPNRPGETLSLGELREADTFVRAVGKLLIHAPEFLVDSYCIWLSVPKHEREIVAEIMNSPKSMGGLSDEMGLEIIEIFIDQNMDELADFFSVQVAGLQKRVTSRMKARRARLDSQK